MRKGEAVAEATKHLEAVVPKVIQDIVTEHENKKHRKMIMLKLFVTEELDHVMISGINKDGTYIEVEGHDATEEINELLDDYYDLANRYLDEED